MRNEDDVPVEDKCVIDMRFSTRPDKDVLFEVKDKRTVSGTGEAVIALFASMQAPKDSDANEAPQAETYRQRTSEILIDPVYESDEFGIRESTPPRKNQNEK